VDDLIQQTLTVTLQPLLDDSQLDRFKDDLKVVYNDAIDSKTTRAEKGEFSLKSLLAGFAVVEDTKVINCDPFALLEYLCSPSPPLGSFPTGAINESSGMK
jgi:hypothetical protein